MTVGHLALIAAFAAGVVSFLWPCVFPLVPGYLSSIAGTTVRDVQGEIAARRAEAIAPSSTSTRSWPTSTASIASPMGWAGGWSPPSDGTCAYWSVNAS